MISNISTQQNDHQTTTRHVPQSRLDLMLPLPPLLPRIITPIQYRNSRNERRARQLEGKFDAWIALEVEGEVVKVRRHAGFVGVQCGGWMVVTSHDEKERERAG